MRHTRYVSSGRPSVRVLIADDHRLFAESLMAGLSIDERIQVVGIARDGREAVELVEELRPNVVLMDLEMPRVSGREATRTIREVYPNTHVIILTGTDGGVEQNELAALGASGYLSKRGSLAELMSMFYEVASLAMLLGAPPAEPVSLTLHRQ